MIYTPLLHLNISALSPALQKFQGYTTAGKAMSAQTKEATPEDKVFETSDKSLEHLEQQLYDFSLTRRAGSSQIRLIHGSYLGLALLSVGLLIYSSYPVLKKMAIRKQRRLLKTRIDQGDDSSLVSIKEFKGKKSRNFFKSKKIFCDRIAMHKFVWFKEFFFELKKLLSGNIFSCVSNLIYW